MDWRGVHHQNALSALSSPQDREHRLKLALRSVDHARWVGVYSVQQEGKEGGSVQEGRQGGEGERVRGTGRDGRGEGGRRGKK